MALHDPHPGQFADEAGREQIRPATWQGFETLVAESCGQYSRVLLGVDGGSGYLYAVGHANGGLWCCICGGSASSTSTDRPNPVGMHRITVVAVDGLRLQVNNLEALDGTPIVDVKPVLGGIPER